MPQNHSPRGHHVLKPYHGHDGDQQPNIECQWFGDSPELNSKYASSKTRGNCEPKYVTDDGWSYFFNSLGYRGEEFNPDAREVIYLCGCSHAFGSGIKWEQTFGFLFRELYCEYRNLTREEVNLQNFSSIGASNDYISRTLATQLGCLRPSLLIAYFTSRTRKEYVKGQRIISLQPGILSGWLETKRSGAGKLKLEASYDYYAFYTDELGFIDTMKNMLLVKFACENLGIPYVFAWQDFADLSNPKFTRNRICNAFIEMLDRHRICNFNLQSMLTDRARDGVHAGPRTNELFARALFQFFLEAQQKPSG
jgi:hypothetical protein